MLNVIVLNVVVPSVTATVVNATFFSLLKLPNYGLLYLLCLSRLGVPGLG
jgi:hypothetical protein